MSATIIQKRILRIIGFGGIAIGVGLLVIALASRFLFNNYEEEVSGFVSGEIISEYLQVVGVQSQQGSETFVLETDLEQAFWDSRLAPLRPSSDFIAKTANEATIVTSRGNIVIRFFQAEAPYTITNFLTLVEEGFYDGLRFHRVDEGFVIQVGDPDSRDTDTLSALLALGAGGPGYRIADEISPNLSHDRPGIVAMANKNHDGSLPDTAGSQFYITKAPATFLDGRYSIFAEVISGMDVVRDIAVGDVITSISYR
ncbi:MAG: peptidylprolyl isomerase [Pseudomonadales bacterium]|jgi:cyclophilin family peptidyl-prolyl cis-trans isomerase|nr:peptidylprolyl isomerase [Pseudomonadales bacterium]